MNLLAIDTTGKEAIIVASINDKNYVELITNEKHSEALLNHIEILLHKAGVTLNDIDVFGNVSGPGSFTGIRIGLSTIKAFAYALGKPVVNVNRFDILSSEVQGYVVMACTKSSVYYGHIDGQKITYGVVDTANMDTVIPTDAQVSVIGEEHLQLPTAYKNIVTISNYNQLILPYMCERAHSGHTQSSKDITPLYIQLSQAERNLEGAK